MVDEKTSPALRLHDALVKLRTLSQDSGKTTWAGLQETLGDDTFNRYQRLVRLPAATRLVFNDPALIPLRDTHLSKLVTAERFLAAVPASGGQPLAGALGGVDEAVVVQLLSAHAVITMVGLGETAFDADEVNDLRADVAALAQEVLAADGLPDGVQRFVIDRLGLLLDDLSNNDLGGPGPLKETVTASIGEMQMRPDLRAQEEHPVVKKLLALLRRGMTLVSDANGLIELGTTAFLAVHSAHHVPLALPSGPPRAG